VRRDDGWHAEAVCRQVDPELFWPLYESEARRAKAVCSRCPVVPECRQLADELGVTEGVWHGHWYRPKLQRGQRKLTALEVIDAGGSVDDASVRTGVPKYTIRRWLVKREQGEG
jgi:WhiB family redox-sensing transcriptional regulator